MHRSFPIDWFGGNPFLSEARITRALSAERRKSFEGIDNMKPIDLRLLVFVSNDDRDKGTLDRNV